MPQACFRAATGSECLGPVMKYNWRLVARASACRVETRLDPCLRARKASTRVSRRQARVPAPRLLLTHLFRDRPLLLFAVALLVSRLATSASGAVRPPAKKAAKTPRPAERPIVRRWLSSLTLSQKVAQLVVIPFYGEAPNTRSRQYRQFLRLVKEEQVGGLILINRTNHGV